MSEPFLGEVRIFGFPFAPKGWAQCNGQLLQIQQNQALFALLGTTFGGDGRTTYGLPNLQGRVPSHPPNISSLGAMTGEATHTLQVTEIPPHTHQAMAGANTANGVAPPTGNVWGELSSVANYRSESDTTLNPGALAIAGSSQPHENRQPFLVVNFCIALVGIFPSRP